MSIELTPGETKFVEDLIAEGEVRSADEAVAKALLRWKRERDLKAAIDEGVRELDAGLGIDSRTMFERTHRELDAALADGIRDFEEGRYRDGEQVFADLKHMAIERIERDAT
jgi:Arc/MetJ-type ribon-helix-helix transcriptional regulator